MCKNTPPFKGWRYKVKIRFEEENKIDLTKQRGRKCEWWVF